MKYKIQDFFLKNSTIIGLYLIACIVASLHLYLLPNNTFDADYTHYNNYIIFKQSFWHLLQGKDLYSLHLSEQYDLFKYSPAFALAMMPFAFLPNWFGLILWNLFNTSIFIYAVFTLPILPLKQKQYILLLCFLECLTSLQSVQTNALLAALFLLSFKNFEQNKPFLSSLFLMLSVFVKLFGLVFFILFLLYPNKVKFIAYSFLLAIILVLIPLLVVDTNQLTFLYKSWLNMLQNDHSLSEGLSIMNWLKTWFYINVSKSYIVAVGLLIQVFSVIIYIKQNTSSQKLLQLSSLFIWVIIFNHKAESSTFIIALVGVGIYAVTMPASKLKTSLIISCFLFTSLSPTDLFPRYVRLNVVVPYVLKAVPCIFIWLHINTTLIKTKLHISNG